MNTSQRILEVLVTRGLVNPEDNQRAMGEVNQAMLEGKQITILQALVNLGIVTDSDVLRATGEAYGVEIVTEITDINPDIAALDKLTEEQAHQLDAVPLGYDKATDTLYVAVSPRRIGSIPYQDDVRRATGVKSVDFKIISTNDLARGWQRVYRAEVSINTLTKGIEQERAKEQKKSPSTAEIEADDESAIQKLVTLLIRQAISDGASDIHMEPNGHSLVMRQRVDGVLRELKVNIDSTLVRKIASVVKIMAKIELSRKNETHDGRMSIRDKSGREMDIRVSIIPSIYGESIVMRLNDNSLASLKLDKLGFSDLNYERFMTAMSKPHGMVLVTGPTGSGKSTTLYAALNQIASPEKKIITVENPVEYRIDGITQIEVNPERSVDDTRKAQKLDFPTVLPAILRHDPDVILVGEVRDKATAQISMDAAMTGHLVLTTLHTNDAASAVIRLKEMGIEPYLVGGVTEGVLAQRLIRRLCARCKEPYTPTASELISVGFWKEDKGESVQLFRAHEGGCAECGNSGYRGRVAVHEVLLLDDTLEEMIVAGATTTEIQRAAQERGMKTLREDGWDKVGQGITSIREVLRVVS